MLLKRRDAVLGKLKDNMTSESFIDLCDAPLSGSAELFLWKALQKAVEKSCHALHDEAIRRR